MAHMLDEEPQWTWHEKDERGLKTQRTQPHISSPYTLGFQATPAFEKLLIFNWFVELPNKPIS